MHLGIELLRLLKNMIYNLNKKFNKQCLVKGAVTLLLLFIISANAFAAEVTSNDEIVSPADNTDEINTNDYIYRKYDEDTKNKLNDNVINYDEIDDLVHEFNPTVLSWWNSYRNDKTATEVYDDYMESYDRIMSSADSSESDAVAARLYAQAYAIKMLADNNTNDSIINFWNYQIDEIKLCLDAKKKFLNFYITDYNKQIAELNVNETKRLANAANVKYQVGVDTELTYLQANKNADDAEANFDLAVSNHNVADKNLKISCGKSISNEVEIGSLPNMAVDFNAINISNDIEIAKANNIYLKIYNRALKNANTDEMKKYYQILVDYANEEIESSVRTYYDALSNQVNSLLTRETTNALMVQQLTKANNDFSNGRISETDYNTAKYNVDVSNVQVKIQYINVLSAYEDYKYAIEKGIASARLQ